MFLSFRSPKNSGSRVRDWVPIYVESLDNDRGVLSTEESRLAEYDDSRSAFSEATANLCESFFTSIMPEQLLGAFGTSLHTQYPCESITWIFARENTRARLEEYFRGRGLRKFGRNDGPEHVTSRVTLSSSCNVEALSASPAFKFFTYLPWRLNLHEFLTHQCFQIMIQSGSLKKELVVGMLPPSIRRYHASRNFRCDRA